MLYISDYLYVGDRELPSLLMFSPFVLYIPNYILHTSFIWGYLHTKFEVSSNAYRELRPAGKNEPPPPRSWKGSKKPGPNRVKSRKLYATAEQHKTFALVER